MPEYLTPGVYVEETSFRSRSIEGVATATFAMAGLTRYGPVPYRVTPAVPAGARQVVMVPRPTLVTSFTEFERAFGSLGNVGADDGRNYLAYAARAFFGNGGRRLYVSRVFPFRQVDSAPAFTGNFASAPVGPTANPLATWRTRWPGAAGNEMSVQVGFKRSKNVLIGNGTNPPRITGLAPGAAVELVANPSQLPDDDTAPTAIRIYDRGPGGAVGFRRPDGGLDPVTGNGACHITLTVTVTWGERTDVYAGLEIGQQHSRSITTVLQSLDPTDEFALVWLDLADTEVDTSAYLTALLAGGARTFLTGASEGDTLRPDVIAGQPADPDAADKAATGLAALAEIDDVAIVSSPNAVSFTDPGQRKEATDNVIGHCTAPKAYRIGIVDPPADSSLSEVRAFRSQFDTSYAALYYPWVRILDPTAKVDPGAPPATLDLPPSGFAAGIYSRSDIERGVHKAPANEVVLGMTKFVANVTHDRQSVLNPEGVNALRFFEGRANRVWGARTLSSDPEWKYINVRRLFIYLEHSIDKSTQWAVFEPNNERLWASIRQSVEDFLTMVWLTGALMGTRPEEAFFVRCDRTTMTQNDLDNGKMICLVGVAPTYPAEFVIFRVGQFTADAQQS